MYVLLTHSAGEDGAHDLDESCAIAWRADRITMGSEHVPEAVLQLPQRRVGKQSYRHGGCPERQGVPAGDKCKCAVSRAARALGQEDATAIASPKSSE